MKRKIILLVVVIFDMFLCQAQEVLPRVWNAENVVDCSGTREEWKAIVKKWDYVFLEKEEQSVEVQDCSILGDYLVVTDRVEGECRLMLYDWRGKFRFRLGELPSGGYIPSPREIIWNPYLEQFFVFEGVFEKKCHLYNNAGKFIKTINCTQSWAFLGGGVFLEPDCLLGYNQVAMRSEPSCFVSNAGLNKKQVLRKHTTLWSQGFYRYAIHPVSVYQQRALIVEPFCDTIYEYQTEKIQPAFVLKTHTSLPEGTSMELSKNYKQASLKCEELGYYQKSDIFETEDQICLVYDNGKLFWHKKNRNGIFISRDSSCFADFIPPLDICGQTEKAVVTVMTYDELCQWEQKMKCKGILTAPVLRQLFRKARKYRSSVLFYYYL